MTREERRLFRYNVVCIVAWALVLALVIVKVVAGV